MDNMILPVTQTCGCYLWLLSLGWYLQAMSNSGHLFLCSPSKILPFPSPLLAHMLAQAGITVLLNHWYHIADCGPGKSNLTLFMHVLHAPKNITCLSCLSPLLLHLSCKCLLLAISNIIYLIFPPKKGTFFYPIQYFCFVVKMPVLVSDQPTVPLCVPQSC